MYNSIMFVCFANRNRSTTAVDVLKEMLAERNVPPDKYEVYSSGINIMCYPGAVQLTKEKADKADKIFVMEKYMVDILNREYEQPLDKIENFNIPDEYDYDDDPLRQILKIKLENFVNELSK